ncbi:hypothetical protein RHMOL_Rhmol03G0009000 [Rhododendron molle]|uniref:Uncharacterized protein n=1 Tax=Rhododendron molle TaxID=49168 RepID=A0ACC0PBH4_RHOML|nr:hypothetical protein RHMOL_Rhmol03G0009000 [Rhododendron molle]
MEESSDIRGGEEDKRDCREIQREREREMGRDQRRERHREREKCRPWRFCLEEKSN